MLAGAPAADILTHLRTGPRSPHGSAHAMGTGTGENRCAGSATPNTACSSNGRIIDAPLTVDCDPTQVTPAVSSAVERHVRYARNHTAARGTTIALCARHEEHHRHSRHRHHGLVFAIGS